MSKKNTDRCSFCNKPKNEVQILISGVDGFICENCVAQAKQILDSELAHKGKSTSKIALSNNLKPKDISAFLDDYVIGQEEAKKTISVAVYNHYKRLNQTITEDDVEIEKKSSQGFESGHRSSLWKSNKVLHEKTDIVINLQAPKPLPKYLIRSHTNSEIRFEGNECKCISYIIYKIIPMIRI